MFLPGTRAAQLFDSWPRNVRDEGLVYVPMSASGYWPNEQFRDSGSVLAHLNPSRLLGEAVRPFSLRRPWQDGLRYSPSAKLGPSPSLGDNGRRAAVGLPCVDCTTWRTVSSRAVMDAPSFTKGCSIKW
jgi:hypothetical protein